MGNCLLHVQVAEFQPPTTRYSKKLFHKWFQAFHTRTRSNHLKVFIYLKSLKLSVKKLICNEVTSCQPASLRKKLFHTSSYIYFAFIFSDASRLLLPKRLWKYVSTISSEESSVTFNLTVQSSWSKSTFFMLNIAFDVLLRTVFVK